ncbi:pleckstrin homology domain-containing family A member 1 isoform X1 [Strongylocentrotus purpuratus]|uniref:PH domain-containing protein n=2 Tax=Strongylocentrotus purpuratus TaxID=7668 RepID=A0A7M7NTR8_STRPU|nr:pleckstrin homology domain-containing family A member 1 isoform X1 [Strongylocentrotus purpuratus]
MPYLDVQGRICGFMNFEQDEESGRFFRRYFVISLEDDCILCYMDNPMNLPEAARRPILEIQLTNISNARIAEKQRPKVEYCFVVTTSKREFYFQADNHRDMEDWVNRINNASKITVPSSVVPGGTLPLGDKNGGDARAVSYKTEVVGGVVIRTPVQQSLSRTQVVNVRQTSFWWKFHFPWRFYFEFRKVVSPCHMTVGANGRKNKNNDKQKDSKMQKPGAQLSGESESDEEVNVYTREAPSSESSPKHVAGSMDKTAARLFPGRNIIESGWCVKQGAVRKSWKRRYFILDDQGISYYKSDQEKIPIRMIPLKEISSCKVAEHGPSIQRDNLFEIISAGRTFFVQAYTPGEMASWIESISDAIATKKKGLEQSVFYLCNETTGFEKQGTLYSNNG